MRHAPPVLFITGLALLTLAWIGGNPPAAGSDETQHYLRALGLGHGQLLGPRHPPGVTATIDDRIVALGVSGPDEIERRRAWIDAVSTVVTVPPGFSPAGLDCISGAMWQPASCQSAAAAMRTGSTERWRTYVGSYSPVGYLPAAVGVRFSAGTVQAMHRGRLAGAALCLALLALAAWCSWRTGGVLSLIGLALAATPMTVFLMGTLTQSGVEVAAAVAVVAGLLRLRRAAPGNVGVVAWTALAVGGFLLAATRIVGPAWLLEAAVVIVVLSHWSDVAAKVRSETVGAIAVGAAWLLGTALSVAWQFYAPTPPPVDVGASLTAVGSSVDALSLYVEQAIGRFGYNETPLPALAVNTWEAAAFVMLGLALAAGSMRERAALAGACAAFAVSMVLMDVLLARPNGYGMIGRYGLPALAIIIMTAADVVAAARRRTPVWRVFTGIYAVAAAVVVGAVQFAAFWWNARRYAVGITGPLAFFRQPAWIPPRGWWLWIALAGAGCSLLAASIVSAWCGGRGATGLIRRLRQRATATMAPSTPAAMMSGSAGSR